MKNKINKVVRRYKKMEQQTEVKKESQNDALSPVFQCRIGAFITSVFLHEFNGRNVPGIALQKSFTKDGTNWKNIKMTLLSTTEIDKLICVLKETKKALYTEKY